jgi:hypothetical protein
MTKEQLDAIREHVSFDDVSIHDVIPLLAEVERLKNDLAMAVQVSGELCEKCGWAMKFPGEPCRCELLAEVERLHIERDALVKEKTTAVMLREDERVMPTEGGMHVQRWCTGTDWPCAIESEPHGHWRTSHKVPVWAVINTERDTAFRRGAEAMREVVARHFEERANQQRLAGDYIMSPVHGASAQRVRHLPTPEDK